jgi:hypothetical protein
MWNLVKCWVACVLFLSKYFCVDLQYCLIWPCIKLPTEINDLYWAIYFIADGFVFSVSGFLGMSCLFCISSYLLLVYELCSNVIKMILWLAFKSSILYVVFYLNQNSIKGTWGGVVSHIRSECCSKVSILYIHVLRTGFPSTYIFCTFSLCVRWLSVYW